MSIILEFIFKLIVQIFVEFLFYMVCGFVGHVVVKALSFGKVDLEWGHSSDSLVAEFCGLFFFFLIIVIIVWIKTS
jgi:hypothetical protein